MSTLSRDKRDRIVRRALTIPRAADAVGPILPGCEIYGLWKGQFDLVDIIQHCLAATGPADVVISTWTAAAADIDFAHALLGDGRLRSLRFIVDFIFPRRQPGYCSALRERFGDGAIRVTKNHAKFVLIRNEQWNLVIRTSANLNRNQRLENFEISDDAAMADYLAEICDDLFVGHGDGEQLDQAPGENVRDFQQLGERTTMFSDQPLGTDVRRAGITTQKGGRPWD